MKFNAITDESLREAIPYFKFHRFNKGDIVINEDIQGPRFYILLKGRIKIVSNKLKTAIQNLKKKIQLLNPSKNSK